jgi:hypothetical protein
MELIAVTLVNYFQCILTLQRSELSTVSCFVWYLIVQQLNIL